MGVPVVLPLNAFEPVPPDAVPRTRVAFIVLAVLQSIIAGVTACFENVVHGYLGLLFSFIWSATLRKTTAAGLLTNCSFLSLLVLHTVARVFSLLPEYDVALRLCALRAENVFAFDTYTLRLALPLCRLVVYTALMLVCLDYYNAVRQPPSPLDSVLSSWMFSPVAQSQGVTPEDTFPGEGVRAVDLALC